MELEFCHFLSQQFPGDKSYSLKSTEFSNLLEPKYNFAVNCQSGIPLITSTSRGSDCDNTFVDSRENKLRVEADDIAGLSEAKSAIFESVVYPLQYPHLFNCRLAMPPRGVLLYGPPGTGKTMLAKWVASCCDSTFYSVSAASIMSKWIGESEKSVKAIFETARLNQPSVIFIDEIDCILGKRSEADHEATRRLKNEFLVSLDGVDTDFRDHIVVIGATNIPWELDEAALRRFSRRIYIPLPSDEGRKQLIHRELSVYARESKTQFNELSNAEWVEIITRTTGYSGSDIKCVLQEAVLISVREVINGAIHSARSIRIEDLRSALNTVGVKCETDRSNPYESWL